MKGAAALSDGNYRKNSDFSQYSSRLFLETESRRAGRSVSHKPRSLVCTHDHHASRRHSRARARSHTRSPRPTCIAASDTRGLPSFEKSTVVCRSDVVCESKPAESFSSFCRGQSCTEPQRADQLSPGYRRLGYAPDSRSMKYSTPVIAVA